MITLLQIDKSGSSLDERNYSIVLAKNKQVAYGCNIPQYIKVSLLCALDSLNLSGNKRRFFIRFHTSIIILLILRATSRNDAISIEICNDFDGHFPDIKQMILSHLLLHKYFINKEDILMTKFSKPSFIDNAGKRFREKCTHKRDIHLDVDFATLFEMIKK